MNAPAIFTRAETVGVDARRALAPGRGKIAAVFRRSFYMRIGQDWVCGGGREIGRGPLNLLLARAPDDWNGLLTPGQPVTIEQDLLCLQGLAPIDLKHIRIWRPEPFPACSPAAVAAGLAALERLLANFPPPVEGFGCFAASEPRPRDLVSRACAPPIEAYLQWLAAGCPEHAESGLRPLLGAGPGLTPSGDDFIAASLLTLHAIRRGDLAGRVWAEILPALPGATHPVSAAHLSCAAEGRLAEAQHRLLQALLCGSQTGLSAGIKALSGESHTSPWDGLAGMAATLRTLSG